MSVDIRLKQKSPPLHMKKEFSINEWRNSIRARVTALKCHIMATQGLTCKGENVAPYAPEILLQLEENAQYIAYADKKDLEEYIAKAMLELCKGKSQDMPVGLDDVQISLNSNSSSSASSQVAIPSETTSTPLIINTDEPDKQVSSIGPTSITNKCEMNELKDQLKLKDREIEKLSNIREEVEGELQELTANLFQEANTMVQEANIRAAASDKSFKESSMQVEVLQAEVAALKTLVLTSTPSAPNPHLHPQIIAKGAQAVMVEAGKFFYRGHKKSPSDFDLKYGRDTTPPSSPLKDNRLQDHMCGLGVDVESCEVDPVLHREFVHWRQEPKLSREDAFVSRIYSEDIDFCLAFPNSTLAHQVQRAIEANVLYIEQVNPRQIHNCPKKCVLLDVPRYCKYRFRLGEHDTSWYYISQLARNRIIAVCDFLNYLRYIQLGLVKSSIHDVYWEVVKLRRQMLQARLGF